MDNILSAVSLIQSIFLLATSFVSPDADKIKPECKSETKYKITRYIHIIIAFLSILLFLLKFYKAINITPTMYAILVFSLTLISFASTIFAFKECGNTIILVEIVGEFLIVSLLVLAIFVSSRNQVVSSQISLKYPNFNKLKID